MARKKQNRTSFDIKSGQLSLITFILKSCDLDMLEAELQSQFGNKTDYFDHDPVIIDLSEIAQVENVTLDFSCLVTLLKKLNMAPFAVRYGSPALTLAAQQAGLIHVPDVGAPASTCAPTSAPSSANNNTPEQKNAKESAPATSRPQPTSGNANTLIIDKPLRSGQQVYARGSDLIVTSVVNFGAEIIADGNIHVYAPLRGRVIAGAQGNPDARIFSTCFEPALFSIAGVFQTTEKPLPTGIQGKPAMVHLQGESLIVEAVPMGSA